MDHIIGVAVLIIQKDVSRPPSGSAFTDFVGEKTTISEEVAVKNMFDVQRLCSTLC